MYIRGSECVPRGGQRGEEQGLGDKVAGVQEGGAEAEVGEEGAAVLVLALLGFGDGGCCGVVSVVRVDLYVLVCTTHIYHAHAHHVKYKHVYIYISMRALKMPAASVCALPGAASSEAR